MLDTALRDLLIRAEYEVKTLGRIAVTTAARLEALDYYVPSLERRFLERKK